ncbi:MAG TPA: hypothetical protein VHT50_24735 [Mycobacterium sp.]|nr:hypothetical protein [Mycobacterium sp.]
MRFLPPITAHIAKSTIQRHWRAGVAVIAGLLLVIVATAPWHDGSNPKPAADTASVATTHAPSKATAKTAAPKPRAHVTNGAVKINAPVTLRASGKTKLPWPSKGQASISIAGIGSFGSGGSGGPVPTASVAKAMTAYIVLRDHPLAGRSQGPKLSVHRAEAKAYAHQARLGMSLVPVRSGEVITERQAVQALMLPSANNMAHILARWDAGSVPAFVKKMNATAKQLGMLHTRYTDPSGFDKHTKSTAEDQVRLATMAMKLQAFRQIVGQHTAVIPVAGLIKNVNKLLREPGVTGIKTGSMSAAGGCLLFSATSKVAGYTATIAGAVLGQRSGSIGDLNQAFVSSHNLLAAVHKALRPVKIIQKNQVVAKVPGTKTVLVAANDVTIPGWRGMVVPSKVTASFSTNPADGAKAGTLTVGHVGKATLVVRTH